MELCLSTAPMALVLGWTAWPPSKNELPTSRCPYVMGVALRVQAYLLAQIKSHADGLVWPARITFEHWSTIESSYVPHAESEFPLWGLLWLFNWSWNTLIAQKLQVGECNAMACSTKNLSTMSVSPSLYPMCGGQHMPYQICSTKLELILTEFCVGRIFASQMDTSTRETRFEWS
jgi:hypothetical protein